MFHIYAVSDGTGKTAEGVVRAALTQFDDSQVNIKRYGGVRSTEQVCEIVEEANQTGGFIVHTMVSEKMRRLMFTEGRAANVATIDLMGPMLARLTDLMATQPRAEPGLFVPFDQAYLLRINVDDLESAEIVLVGVSRTSKTPLSIYLAYRGWRVANVPIVLGVDPPPQLFDLPKRRVVGLIVKPARLVELRHVRVKHMGVSPMGYADLEYIKQEVAYAYELFEKRRDWPLVDVTTKPIEETAAEVVALVGKREQGVL
jgi:regulator of PEP synthase PpsR (kinase-PPPase family)